MLKNRTIILGLTIFAIVGFFTVPKTAKAYQNQDMSGKMFNEGYFKGVNPADLTFEEILNRIMFNETTLEIAKDGKISGNANAPISGGPPFTEYNKNITGNAALSMEGNYSHKDNLLTGKFSITQNTFRKNKFDPENPSLILRSESYNIKYEGSFKGSFADTGNLNLDFSGTKNYAFEGISKDRDGKLLDTADAGKNSHTSESNFRVNFYDYGQGMGTSGANIDLKGGLIRGTAKFSRDKGIEWFDINKDEPLEVKVYDIIETGPNTRMLIKYADGSVFRLKSNTKLTILPNGIQLEYGDSFFNLQKQGKNFKVVTPTTVCGVLGTTFGVTHSKDTGETSVELLEGSVEAIITESEEKIMLVPGIKLTVTGNEALRDTFEYAGKLEEENKNFDEDLANTGLGSSVIADSTSEESPNTMLKNKEDNNGEGKNESNSNSWIVGIIILVIIITVVKYKFKK